MIANSAVPSGASVHARGGPKPVPSQVYTAGGLAYSWKAVLAKVKLAYGAHAGARSGPLKHA